MKNEFGRNTWGRKGVATPRQRDGGGVQGSLLEKWGMIYLLIRARQGNAKANMIHGSFPTWQDLS